MVDSKQRAPTDETFSLPNSGCEVLIIEARFYQDIADELVNGACAELDVHRVKYTRISVPGALEIPQALRAAVLNSGIGQGQRYSGAVILGCVIRGETSHYDIVCNNANHWVMTQAIENNIPVGNGLLTVDTKQQAVKRAQGGRSGKGGDAARACLRIIELQHDFEGQGV